MTLMLGGISIPIIQLRRTIRTSSSYITSNYNSSSEKAQWRHVTVLHLHCKNDKGSGSWFDDY